MKVLFIGAHNDDCEFNAGGIANLLFKSGCDIRFVNIASIWQGENISEQTRKEWEQQEIDAAKILGAIKIQTADRYAGLYMENAEEVKKLAAIIRDYSPDICFIHWPNDNHIEHREAARVSEKALCLAHVWGSKVKEIYAFEAGADQTSDYFKPDFFIEIDDVMDTLHKSLMCFNQNTANGRGLCHYKDMLAKYRGSQCLKNYAEAFKIVKFPDGSDDFIIRNLLSDYFHWNGNGMYPSGAHEYF